MRNNISYIHLHLIDNTFIINILYTLNYQQGLTFVLLCGIYLTKTRLLHYLYYYLLFNYNNNLLKCIYELSNTINSFLCFVYIELINFYKL